jgi:molecular chaperone DnaK (HSP70)
MDQETSESVLFRVPFRSAEGTQEDENMLTLLPQKVGSYIVNHLMQLAHAHLGHDNVKSAVICIPAKFNAAQRAATVQAFQNAGVSVARILEEPTAAALAYGLDKKENINFIMVYDFGGGTLDVSLLQVADGGYVDVMGSDGDDRLGGADFDAAVARHLLENDISGGAVRKVTNAMKQIEVSQTNEGDDYDLEEMLDHSCVKLQSQPLCTLSSFHTIAEKMKIGLSAYTDGEDGMVEEYCLGLTHDVDLPILLSIEQFCDALQPIQLRLTTAEYDIAVNPLYKRSILPVRRILKDLNLQRDEIDEVVMVGGTTRMPQIREIVRKELGVLSLNTHIDPDLTVAYGAASVID